LPGTTPGFPINLQYVVTPCPVSNAGLPGVASSGQVHDCKRNLLPQEEEVFTFAQRQ
jgi:hypothetical protein